MAKEPSKENKNQKPEKCEKKPCNKKGWIIGGIIAAVLIIVAIIVFAVIKPFSKSLVGDYELTGLISSEGEDQSSSLALMKAFGISPELKITDGKSGTMTISDESVKFTYDGKKFYFEAENEDDSEASKESEYSFKDDQITLKSDDSDMIFTKKKN